MGNSNRREAAAAARSAAYQPPAAGAQAAAQQHYLYGGQDPLRTLRLGPGRGTGAGEAPAPPVQRQSTYTIRNLVHMRKETLRITRSRGGDGGDGGGAGLYGIVFTYGASVPSHVSVALTFATAAPAEMLLPPTAEVALPAGLEQEFRQSEHEDCPRLDLRGVELHMPVRMQVTITLRPDRAEGGGDGGGGNKGGGGSGGGRADLPEQWTFATLVLKPVPGGWPTCSCEVERQEVRLNGATMELQDIYGIEGSTNQGTMAADAAVAGAGGGADSAASAPASSETLAGAECVICMTEQRDTTIMPCRHMCLCAECAEDLRMRSNTCPICRTPAQSYLQIKVSEQRA